jgi:hypothetical protein
VSTARQGYRGAVVTMRLWIGASAGPDESSTGDCPFCLAGLRHARHVPAAFVTVGPDFGEIG